MRFLRWLVKRLRGKLEPLDIKYHLDDIIVAYDDVDLVLFTKSKKSKGS